MLLRLGIALDYKVIDIHVHITPWEMLNPAAAALMEATQPDHVLLHELSTDPARLVAYMDAHNIEWLGLINYLSPEVMGYTEEVNDFSASFAAHYPHRFIPYGGVDPRLTSDMAAHTDHLLGELRLKALKIHPPHQLFNVNDYLFDPDLKSLTVVYEKCIEYDVPLMVHTGTSIFRGARNRFADPMPVDDVAVDFPDLKIILAHAGRPLYSDAAFFLLRRHPHVWCDISSTPPGSVLSYFPWLERVPDKVMFGSDWPGPGVRDIGDNIQQFLSLDLSDEVKRKILRDNAIRVFGLAEP
jgi:predicted TIM-barrel fold metal-dependent hydrolase